MNQLEKNNVSISNSEKLTKNIIEYLKGNEELDNNFSKNEINHMQDVKKLIDLAKLIMFISAAIIIISILLALFIIKKLLKLLKAIFFGALVTLAILILIALGAMFNFGSSFAYFHELFFPQGNWMFPQGSLLITLLPQSFFVSISQAIFTSGIILSLTLIVLTHFSIKNNKKRAKQINKEKTKTRKTRKKNKNKKK